MDRSKIGFALTGSFLSIIFLVVLNFLMSPNFLWFIYPAFVLLMWPLSLFLILKGKHKLYSVLSSGLIIALILSINILHSPGHPWFLYAVFPILWWPISMFAGQKVRTLSFALIASLSTGLYYFMLNLIISPGYPWFIYPVYALLLWPLVLYYARNKKFFNLSISFSLVTILFFIVVNVVSTPSVIWAIYPIFLILWWPLSMYFYQYKKNELSNKLTQELREEINA